MSYKKFTNLTKRWGRDKRGSMAMMMSISTLVVLMAAGASIDITNLTRQKDQAQALADTMALAAAIAVDQDNSDRYVEGQGYSYQQVTGVFKKSAEGMTGKIKYDIVDDEDADNADKAEDDKSRLLARATVDGVYKSAFAGIFPKYATIEYSVTSDVAYGKMGGKPATVFFAVDNSGSMGWLDASGANKLASLESSMRGFMDILDAVNTDDNDVFRTALYPYSQDYSGWYNTIDDDGVIPGKVVSPNWGTLTNTEVNNMSTLYGTDSSGALEDALTAFGSEDAIHYAKNDTPDPLKYMIFMSDGSNNSSYECKTESVWVDAGEEYWIDTYNGWNDRYTSEQWWFDSWVVHYPASGGGYQDQETCSTAYHADDQSIASCNAMKDIGVTVYSVGYSLIAGVNGVSTADVTRAKDLLEACASTSEHYILAASASQLDAVFEDIGEEIVEEVIRVLR